MKVPVMHRLTACERSEPLSVQGYTRSVLVTEFAACEWAPASSRRSVFSEGCVKNRGERLSERLGERLGERLSEGLGERLSEAVCI